MTDIPEASTLACDERLALVSCFVPGLPQTLLVQVLGLPLGRASHGFSLFAVYREAGTTFELICAFDCDSPGEPLDVLLAHFIRSPHFEQALLCPLREQVRRHFRR